MFSKNDSFCRSKGGSSHVVAEGGGTISGYTGGAKAWEIRFEACQPRASVKLKARDIQGGTARDWPVRDDGRTSLGSCHRKLN
jgi:hypothetical protein